MPDLTAACRKSANARSRAAFSQSCGCAYYRSKKCSSAEHFFPRPGQGLQRASALWTCPTEGRICACVKGRGLSLGYGEPQLDRSRGTRPLSGTLGYAPSVLRSGKLAEGGERCSFSLGHCSRRVRRRLFCGQTVKQNAGFVIRADRGDLQNRSAVAGLDEALFVARLSRLTERHSHTVRMSRWSMRPVERGWEV